MQRLGEAPPHCLEGRGGWAPLQCGRMKALNKKWGVPSVES